MSRSKLLMKSFTMCEVMWSCKRFDVQASRPSLTLSSTRLVSGVTAWRLGLGRAKQTLRSNTIRGPKFDLDLKVMGHRTPRLEWFKFLITPPGIFTSFLETPAIRRPLGLQHIFHYLRNGLVTRQGCQGLVFTSFNVLTRSLNPDDSGKLALVSFKYIRKASASNWQSAAIRFPF
ncbi:hypothetical protein BD410DRAFT_485205 [Rickenella mellea]|uniref:Uncharacterized protein n=1 Tax=Rickenella mellea TaxID=50990 RepID=A0A4Y7QIN4_9AGAM|nr:hypothetical protein BD410DRAFT_485205 [Rickenella mellea]